MAPQRRLVSRREFLSRSALALAAASLVSLPACTTTQGCTLDDLNITSRTDWKALEPNHEAQGENGFYNPITNPDGWREYTQPLTEIFNTLIIHHSALPVSDGPLEIQKLHQTNKGFADIGYHFVIDADGQIYAGRALNVRGAHTGGHNTGTLGIVLLGNFEVEVPPDKQLQSLKELTHCLTSEFGFTHLAGHRDFQPDETVCPGKNLEPQLPDLARELGLKFGTDGYILNP